MRTRTTLAAGLLAAGVFALTGCGGGGGSDAKGASTTPASVAAPATTPRTTTTAAAKTTPTPSPSTTKPKAKPKPTVTDCMPGRDVYVWEKVAGVPAMAQALGDYANCGRQSTFDMLSDTSPTDPGDCTEAAWVSDNPGYNADAEPAKRLKHVQVSIGPAC